MKLGEETAIAETLKLISKGLLEEACLVCATFESKQEYPRFGTSLKESHLRTSLQMQKWIAGLIPAILFDCPSELIEPARIGAGMMELWGTNSTRNYLSIKGEWTYRLTLDVVSRMLVFRASTERSLAGFERCGFKEIVVLGAEDSCENCKSIGGRKFAISNAPELPYRDCTCERGCGCLFIVEQ